METGNDLLKEVLISLAAGEGRCIELIVYM